MRPVTGVALGLAAMGAWAALQNRGARSVTDTFYQTETKTVAMEFPVIPIRDSAAPRVALTQPQAGDGAYLRPWANLRLNSRIGQSIGDGAWRAKWQAALPENLGAQFVFKMGARVVVQGRAQWQVVDAAD